MLSGVSIRLGRVGEQVNALDLNEISTVLSGAQLQGRLAGDLEVFVHNDVCVAIKDAEGRGRRQASREAGGESRESHREICVTA